MDDLYRAGLALIDIRDFETPWEVRPFDREAEIDDLVERALRLAETARKRSSERDYLFHDFEDLLSFVQDLEGQEQVSGRRDYDALEHRLPALKLGRRKGRGAYGSGVVREELLAEREALATRLRISERARPPTAPRTLQNELREVVERYQEAKSKRGRLDFLDLLAKARDLLRDDDELRKQLQRRFTHIFVDEFQDTDPLQAEILLLLAADNADDNRLASGQARARANSSSSPIPSNQSTDSGAPTSRCISASSGSSSPPARSPST